MLICIFRFSVAIEKRLLDGKLYSGTLFVLSLTILLCDEADALYKVIILSDNCQSSFSVDSFIVLLYPIHPTTHWGGGIATEKDKR